MSDLSYWERRQVNRFFEYMQSAEDVSDQIAKLYQAASGYISSYLDEIFERFQRKHKLSEAEARRLLAKLQDSASLAELKAALQQSKDKAEIADLLAELEAPAYQARLDRLQQLQNELDRVMQQIYHQEKLRSTSFYVDLAKRSYYESIFQIQQYAGVAFDFSVVDPKMIDLVVGSSWAGANYSSRIWQNTGALAKSLKEELLISLVTGRTDRETAGIIANKFAVGAGKARRLVRTESAYVAAQLDMEGYKECGIETYIFLATLDLKTSKVCRSMDHKRFPVSAQESGKNCPPMHPWCRSTTICDISDQDLANMRRWARDPVTGKSTKVPGDMTYGQWYDQYVKGKPEAELAEKKIKNRSADRKQYARYKKILGDDVPKSLDDFQEMKYTDGNTWKNLQREYRIVNQYEVVAGTPSAKKIVEMHELNERARAEFAGRYGRDGNVATARCNGIDFVAHSKVADANSRHYRKYNGHCTFVFEKSDAERQFVTQVIGWDRKVDGEAKLFEHLNAEFGNQKMQVYMNTGFPMCDSCKEVLRQYCLKNPDVEVNVISRKGTMYERE